MIIYKATNINNDNCYIGLTNKPLLDRKADHTRCNGKKDWVFQRALIKYGSESFFWEVIDSDATSYDHLKQLEIWYIEHLKPEYNMTKGGEGTKGLKWSDKSKRKLSESTKGKKKSPEHIAKIAASKRGKKFSDQAKENMSLSRKNNPNINKHFIGKKT